MRRLPVHHIVSLVLLGVAFAIVFVAYSYRLEDTITITTLLIFPIIMGVFVSHGLYLYRNKSLTIEDDNLVPSWTTLFICILGAIIWGEGVICIIMASPVIWVGALIGEIIYEFFGRRIYEDNSTLKLSITAAIPFFMLLAEANLPVSAKTYTVTRHIDIAASSEEIWPLLLRLEELSPDEGRWNVTQDVLSIPRPSQAVVVERDGTLVRLAGWGPNIRFEEHITQSVKGLSLSWDFVFPDDSVSAFTDEHISVDGPHLSVLTGGYELESRGETTRLILTTSYEARTPVNLYASLWGEFILGDIQNNVLTVIKDRAEKP